MPLTVHMHSATGAHGPIEIPEGFLADVDDPTPLEVAAEFSRRLVEDAKAAGLPRELGFRAPLTITVEEN